MRLSVGYTLKLLIGEGIRTREEEMSKAVMQIITEAGWSILKLGDQYWSWVINLGGLLYNFINYRER